jgi:hypothetical protein
MWGHMRRGRHDGARRRPARPAVATLLTLLVTLPLAACGGSSGSPDPASPAPATSSATVQPSPSPTPSLNPTEAARRDALATYRAMWDDWVTAAATSDYESTLLARHAADSALSVIYRAVYFNARNHVVVKGRPILHPAVTATDSPVGPLRITIIDCVDTTHWLNYKPDGSLQDNVPGGFRRVQALLLKTGDSWKVDQLVVARKGACTVSS